MKHTLTAFLFLSAVSVAFSQDIDFNVHGAYQRPVKEEILYRAQTLTDLCTGYPEAWVKNYLSTEITVSSSGKTLKAQGHSHNLTEAQQALLKKADSGTDVMVDVKYKYPNSVTGADEVLTLNFVLTHIPDVEAQFSGGKEEFRKYIREQTVNKIPAASSKNLKPALLHFTVDAQGNITNVYVSQSSGDSHVDALLLQAINNMPAWQPAVNSKGEKTSQDFKFSFGNPGC